jgi:hypothetical protein
MGMKIKGLIKTLDCVFINNISFIERKYSYSSTDLAGDAVKN